MDFNGTFLASIISFLLFVFLMNKLLYEPVRKIVTARSNFIEGNYSEAEENNKKADELSQEREEKLDGAKEDARERYNEILGGFKDKKADIVKEAQENAQNELDEAYKNLENVSNEAKERLKGSMTDLANDIVEKILGYRSDVQGFNNESVNDILYNQKG